MLTSPVLQRCLNTEQKGMAAVQRWLAARDWVAVSTATGSGLSPELQRTAGDLIANTPQGQCRCLEVKVEERATGNLFLETFSNRQRLTPGWLQYAQADALLYYFLDSEMLYWCALSRLKQWAFAPHAHYAAGSRLHDFPLVLQRKTTQKNDTWGHLVPVDVLTREAGLSAYPCPAHE